LNGRQAIAAIPGNYELNSSGSEGAGEKRSNAFIVVDQNDWCRTGGHKTNFLENQLSGGRDPQQQ
jgi:hypothetical protein